ncbi:MAG: hypothetical protein ACR2NV_06590, partial [Thermoleophilaceae bacterium]
MGASARSGFGASARSGFGVSVARGSGFSPASARSGAGTVFGVGLESFAGASSTRADTFGRSASEVSMLIATRGSSAGRPGPAP